MFGIRRRRIIPRSVSILGTRVNLRTGSTRTKLLGPFYWKTKGVKR